jgi:FkbM family methyltransferase
VIFTKLDRNIAYYLPGDWLKDIYPRAMRRLAEYGLLTGSYVVETDFGFRMHVNHLDAIRWYIYYFRKFEPVISKAWTKLLQPGDTVLDIGGNIGYHALLASHCVGPAGKVFTFEPSSRIFAAQAANIALNHATNVTAIQKAVSNMSGHVDLHYGGDNIQGNSSIFGTADHTAKESVECLSFDDISTFVDLSKIKLIKIDVEGAEGLVLEGLQRHVEKLPYDAVIFLEISPENAVCADALIRPFREAGYVAKSIPNDYSPKFYRSETQVEFADLKFEPNKIQDVVLSRDIAAFELMTS